MWAQVNERVAERVDEPELKRAGHSKTRQSHGEVIQISGEQCNKCGVRGIRLAQLLSPLGTLPAGPVQNTLGAASSLSIVSFDGGWGSRYSRITGAS